MTKLSIKPIIHLLTWRIKTMLHLTHSMDYCVRCDILIPCCITKLRGHRSFQLFSHSPNFHFPRSVARPVLLLPNKTQGMLPDLCYYYQIKPARRQSFSHIQRICSRRLWKHLNDKVKNLPKWRHSYWIELKTSCQKEKLLVLSNFFFCHKVFKSPLLQMHLNVSTSEKELIHFVTF